MRDVWVVHLNDLVFLIVVSHSSLWFFAHASHPLIFFTFHKFHSTFGFFLLLFSALVSFIYHFVLIDYGLLFVSHAIGFFIFLVHGIEFRLRFMEGLIDFFEVGFLRWLHKLALIRFIGYVTIAFG